MQSMQDTYPLSRRFSIAPMMEWTDRHERYFLRLFSKNLRLYTEMITADAIIHGREERLLAFSEAEHPVACQLGGSSPTKLAKAVKIVENFGYDEVNLNAGCPSSRVQSGDFGAAMMGNKQLLCDCLSAMSDAASSIPVTLKCRIGIDEYDSYDFLADIIGDIHEKAGVHIFIIHARIAILDGLSPKENREIPPLKYEYVYRLKQDFPKLHITLNGGVETLADSKRHLEKLDGVMMGRAAYRTPWILKDVDAIIFNDKKTGSIEAPLDILQKMTPYISEQTAAFVPIHCITRHLIGLFHGMNGAKYFRRAFSEQARLAKTPDDAMQWYSGILNDLQRYLS